MGKKVKKDDKGPPDDVVGTGMPRVLYPLGGHNVLKRTEKRWSQKADQKNSAFKSRHCFGVRRPTKCQIH